MNEINFGYLALSVVAGLLSFLSPCVLPLLPAYLSYLGGATVAEIQAGSSGVQRRLVLGSVMFVAGLATTFTLYGASASFIGQILIEYQPLILQVAGVTLVLFGLHMAGLLNIPILDRTVRVQSLPASGWGGAYIMGAAFGIGWTPCIGTFLAGVLALASQESTVWQGMLLLFAYSLGLGIPFVLSGLAAGQIFKFLARMRPQLGLVSRISGGVLIVMGILVFSGQMLWLSGVLSRVFGTGITL